MTKIKFFKIGTEEFSHWKRPTEKFYAMRLSLQAKRKLYPQYEDETLRQIDLLMPKSDRLFCDENEIFIYGLGRRKFGKTNKIEVPVFSGNLEDWDEYLKTYGRYCLYYSLTGYELDCFDACACPTQYEFLSILQCKGGIKKYQKYIDNIFKIREIQEKKITETFKGSKSKYYLESMLKELSTEPSFAIMGCSMPPYLNSMADDEKLENFYTEKRKIEFWNAHNYKSRLDEISNRMKELRKQNEDDELLEDEYSSLYTEIFNEWNQVISKEIYGDDPVFPISMSKRMEMIYGKECVELYDKILKEFKS